MKINVKILIGVYGCNNEILTPESDVNNILEILWSLMTTTASKSKHVDD